MTEQQAQILIELLENVEKKQVEQDKKLTELQLILVQRQEVPPKVSEAINFNGVFFEPLFDRLESNKRTIVEELSRIWQNGASGTRIGKFNLIATATIFLILIGASFVYYKTEMENKIREETTKQIVEYYTMKNRKEKLSIDSISKSLDYEEYYSTLKSIKK